MSKPLPVNQWDAQCDCGDSYGESFDTEQEALNFIRNYPLCGNCEDES